MSATTAPMATGECGSPYGVRARRLAGAGWRVWCEGPESKAPSGAGRPGARQSPAPDAHRRRDLGERDSAPTGPTGSGGATSPTCAAWEGASFSSFVIDAFSAGSWAGSSPPTCAPTWCSTPAHGFGAARARRDFALVTHTDRGSQYTSADYTPRNLTTTARPRFCRVCRRCLRQVCVPATFRVASQAKDGLHAEQLWRRPKRRGILMQQTINPQRFAVLAVGVVAVLTLAFAASSNAERIYKSVPTYLALSATRAADGTITAKAVFTSPNPHCLSADRWKKLSDGHYHDVGGGLEYGGPWGGNPMGADGYAQPSGGWLSPVSPAGKSPFVWQAIYPGSMTVEVHDERRAGSEEARDYESTVAAASGIAFGGNAPPNFKGKTYYKYTYSQGGNRIILKCRRTTASRTFVF
jgi:hypothetical protein